MTAIGDDKYCSHHLTQPECDKDDGCFWTEKPISGWLSSTEIIPGKTCVDKIGYDKYKNDWDSSRWNPWVINIKKQKQETETRVAEARAPQTTELPVSLEQTKPKKGALVMPHYIPKKLTPEEKEAKKLSDAQERERLSLKS